MTVALTSTIFEDWLGTGPVAGIVVAIGVLLAAGLVYLALDRVVLARTARLARRTDFRWDDVIVDKRFRRWFSLMLAMLLVRGSVGIVPGLNGFWTEFWIRLSVALAISCGTLAGSTLLMSINSVYETYPLSRERPIKGYLQVVQMVAYVFGDIWVLAVLTNRTPWYLLSGLGAAAAVLLVLYRDTIMSLAASLQMAQNDMVRVGDWIEMPEFGANGTVTEMALATVKVQNWDNTISTVPTHRMTSGSVKNWRGMAEAGTRRIRFAIHLDISSIDFIEHQRPEHRETDWAKFEAIQGDIISHALAVLPRFGLRAFQHPTDSAIRSRSLGQNAYSA